MQWIMGGKAGLLAAFNFGSELIVPQIYSPILQGLTHSIGLINEEAKFLNLHIDMDEDHEVCEKSSYQVAERRLKELHL